MEKYLETSIFCAFIFIVSCPAPRQEGGSGSPHIQSWGSITSAVPDLDRRCDWLTIHVVLDH